MSLETIAGVEIALNEEGFVIDPNQWNEDVAVELARREGIDPLTDRHWEVIRFMRHEYETKGSGPSVRILGKTCLLYTSQRLCDQQRRACDFTQRGGSAAQSASVPA